MKVMKNLIRHTAIIVLSTAIFSCSDGEDGAIGPQGEQGLQGETGQQGDVGAQGDQGDPGTANVIYSDWIPNGFSTGGGANQRLFTLATPQEITDLGVDLDTSVVMVYGRGDNIFFSFGSEVVPLPFERRSIEQLYTFVVSNGRIRVLGLVIGGNSNDFDLFDDYRYVIIPGGVAKSSIDHSTMSYKEITALYNIPE